jgi:hypothetical protein
VSDPLHLRLAGVIRLSLGGKGPKDAFLFDPHRLALPCWALALGGQRDAVLVTLDRHFDLVHPQDLAKIPEAGADLRTLDEFTRWELDVRNYDHVMAAMELGLVGDVIAIARTRPRGSLEADRYVDRTGRTHQIVSSPDVDRLSNGYGTAGATEASAAAERLLGSGRPVLLDVDLDCFTSLCDADPTEIVPWPQALIHRHLLPPGSERFWEAVLANALVLTFAKEPSHCGGVIASNRLFEDAAEVIFGELLGAELP